jgi:CRISPR-associated protein Csb3
MSIRINVDPTNPGQFFACCGLFELADRLWPGAEARFDNEDILIECGGTLAQLLSELSKAEINSSLTDRGLKRLGTLLSAEKAKLTPAELQEKQLLSDQWKRERLHLSKPFDLWLDWWSDDKTGAKGMKTWAAKQLVLEIARPLLRSFANLKWDDSAMNDCIKRTAEGDGLPFYFDSHNNSQNTPRDTGFGLYTLRNEIKTQANTRPLLELAAFVGIQRFRPAAAQAKKSFRFSLWPILLPIAVAGAAVAGHLCLPQERQYEFRMLNRSEYMKAFLPAHPFEGD